MSAIEPKPTVDHADTVLTFYVRDSEPIRQGSVRIVPSLVTITLPPGGGATWRTWLSVTGRVLRLGDDSLSSRSRRVVFGDAQRDRAWVTPISEAPDWVRALWAEHVGGAA